MDQPSPTFAQQQPMYAQTQPQRGSFLQNAANVATQLGNIALQNPDVRKSVSQYIPPEQLSQGLASANQYVQGPQQQYQAQFRPPQGQTLSRQLTDPNTQQAIGQGLENAFEKYSPVGRGIKIARALAFIVAIVSSILLITFLGLAIYESSNNRSAMGWEIGALVSAILAILAVSGLAIGDWWHARRQRETVGAVAAPAAQGLQLFQGMFGKKSR